MNEDFIIENNTVIRYTGTDEVVHIPEGITAIGERAFMGCRDMKELFLPEGLLTIGQSAFSPCASLEKIHFPESLDTLDEFAFSNCRSLKEIELPDTLSHINRSSFSMCRGLREVRLPESLTVLPRGVFLGCTALKKVIITKNVQKIDVEAFSNCTALMDFEVDPENTAFKDQDGVLYSKDGKTLVFFPGGRIEIMIPEGTDSIGESAFYENRMFDRISLPSTLKHIGKRSFYRCSELMHIDLPDGLESLGESSFEGCALLERLIFPDSMKKIEESSFRNCRELMWIRVPEDMGFDLHWFAAPHDPPCYSVDRSIIPFVNTRPVDTIDSEAGVRRAASGYIMAELAQIAVRDDIAAGYKDYIKENVRDFYDIILADEGFMRWMCENDMIPMDDIENLLDGAADKGSAWASALLLGYQKRRQIRMESGIAEKPEVTASEQLENRFSALENALDF